MGVFSEKGDCDMMGKSKGSVKGVLTCYPSYIADGRLRSIRQRTHRLFQEKRDHRVSEGRTPRGASEYAHPSGLFQQQNPEYHTDV